MPQLKGHQYEVLEGTYINKMGVGSSKKVLGCQERRNFNLKSVGHLMFLAFLRQKANEAVTPHSPICKLKQDVGFAAPAVIFAASYLHQTGHKSLNNSQEVMDMKDVLSFAVSKEQSVLALFLFYSAYLLSFYLPKCPNSIARL